MAVRLTHQGENHAWYWKTSQLHRANEVVGSGKRTNSLILQRYSHLKVVSDCSVQMCMYEREKEAQRRERQRECENMIKTHGANINNMQLLKKYYHVYVPTQIYMCQIHAGACGGGGHLIPWRQSYRWL